MSALEFYFEFSSPYAYFASERVEAECGRLGLAVDWRPLMLGPILRRTGQRPLLTDGVRGRYARQDCLRWARLHGIPFRLPALHPVNSLKAARGALLLKHAGLCVAGGAAGAGAADAADAKAGPALLAAYVHACFRAYWEAGRDLFQDEVLADLVAGLGMEVQAFQAGIAAPEAKERLKRETDAAWERGVFGTPTFFYRDEMLWGNDRLPLLERLVREDRAQAG
jgi:2-hydroxychromene-2-carboxylate isomerase